MDQERIEGNLSKQWLLMKAAPLPYASGLIGAAVVMFLVIQWGYGRVLDQRESQITNLNTRVTSLEGERDFYKGKWEDADRQLASRPEQLSEKTYASLSQVQIADLTERLRPLVKPTEQIGVNYVQNDSAIKMATKLHDIFKSAGATMFGGLVGMTKEDGTGVHLLISDPAHPSEDDQKIMDAFRLTNIPVSVGELGDRYQPSAPFQITVSYPP